MVCSRKLLVVSLMGVILTRITSAFARLAETWTGSGDAYSYLGAAYPWHECKISISDYVDIFYGKFYVNIDNHDTFKDKTNLSLLRNRLRSKEARP